MVTKVALITGASSGLGYQAAEALIALGGWTVFAGARRVEAMQPLADLGGRIFELDVTDSSSVARVVDEILTSEGAIDALLANAGYGCYGMIETVPLEEIHRQFDVNVFGVARCIQAVLPHMRARRSGRIVVTESLVSHVSTLGIGWYAATKHALRAVTVALRQEVRDLGIQVVSVQPGVVDTGFAEVALSALRFADQPEDYRELAEECHAFLAGLYEGAPGPGTTTDAMVQALTSKTPKTVYRTTTDAKLAPLAVRLLPDSIFDSLMLRSVRKAGRSADRNRDPG